MSDPDRIVQLIPGGGWTARYAGNNGAEVSAPVLAWALTAEGDVYALDSDARGVVDRVDTTGNFIRLVEPAVE